MLRLLEGEIKLPFPPSPMSAEIEALMKTYGFETSFAMFWIQEKEGVITAAVSKVDSHVTVAAGEAFDAAELKEFLKVIGFSSLLGEKRVLKDLGFKISQKGIIMKYKHVDVTDGPVCTSPQDEPPYGKIYELLKMPDAFGESIPSYGDWLCDVSARMRKSCASVSWREKDGKCVSCGMFTFESEAAAVIGAVAVHKDYRRRGSGSDIVRELCHRSAVQGKEVFLMCEKDVTPFYKKLDFEISGEFSLCSGVYDE